MQVHRVRRFERRQVASATRLHAREVGRGCRYETWSRQEPLSRPCVGRTTCTAVLSCSVIFVSGRTFFLQRLRGKGLRMLTSTAQAVQPASKAYAPVIRSARRRERETQWGPGTLSITMTCLFLVLSRDRNELVLADTQAVRRSTE